MLYRKLKNITRQSNVPSGDVQNVPEKQPHKTYNTMNDTPKNQPKNTDEEKRLALNPIGGLQELCTSRKWPFPKYEFSKKYNHRTVTFTAECTVMLYSVRVEGLPLKKVEKREVTTMMCCTLLNVDNNDLVPTKNDSQINVSELPHMGEGLLDDTSALASEGLDVEPATAALVGPPVSLDLTEDSTALDVNEVPMLEVTKKVLDRQPPILAADDTANLVVTTESLNCVKDNGEQPVHYSVVEEDQLLTDPEDTDLAVRLRLLKNSGIRELKELNAINTITVPSGIELVCRIAEEEGLTLDFDVVCTTSSTAQNKKNDMMTVQLDVNSGALMVVGFGETIYDSQEDAVNRCLTSIKLMLQE